MNHNNIENLTDEQALEVLKQLLASKLKIGMAYVPDPTTGVLTHQILMIKVGDLEMHSGPEKMEVPLMPVVTKRKEETAH